MVKLVYAVLFGCVMVVGLPLNAVSLWILLHRHNLKSPNVVFMVNLAISDLLLVISLPLRVYVYATGTWPLSTTACTLVTILFRSNIRSSFIFITFISVDRLLAVVYPLKSRHLRTSSNAWRAVALIWMFILVSNIPEGLASSRIPCNNSEPTCFEFCRHPRRPPVYFQTVLVFAMLAVNVACTALVTWTLRRNLNESVRVHNKIIRLHL
ncbi:lysophosphatidic acid receptor 6-like [Toxotes jaculatrix]|uniref:lysophosphatidic acid receptor 6-like n=1 Tax=Toxotes jaculatrix TaxID=941984 RepID=UPI001B3A8BBB|nr:lysophosphatidic acid receptor 6-like [Toxotes jaculatrix]